MSEFTFTENGETYVVKGPNGMTIEQARSIFSQQFNTGALTGFNVGDTLSAATQAADGLITAAPQLSQGIAVAAKILPTGINASTITAALGPNGSAAAGQVTSALQGTVAAAASTLTTGSANFSRFTGGISTQVQTSGIANIGLNSSVATRALTGQAAQIGSVANTALNTLTRSIAAVPLQGIDTANFSKQLPSLGGIGNLSQTDVTGTLAQASKIVGQSFSKVTNSLGVGKFGFDVSQLERAGVVKPGTASTFLQSGSQNLVGVLKSPTVWTGKDGIKNLDGLLKNSGLQDKIQQGLMTSGMNDIKQLGIPVDGLKPEALSGLLTNAAKSVPATVSWITNSPTVPQIPTIPGGDIKKAFNNMASNAAFAVKFTNNKVESALKQQEPVDPSTDTVNSKTVDAAATRLVGNNKVPNVVPDGTISSARAAVLGWADFTLEQNASLDALEQKLIQLTNSRGPITQQQWNTVNQEFQIIKTTISSRSTGLQDAAVNAINSVPADQRDNLKRVFEAAQNTAKLLSEIDARIKKLIADLANKIAT